MSALTPWRRELRALIPRGFLRRDQGDGLLISDYPRFGDAEEITGRLLRAGYRVELRGDLACLDGLPEKYAGLIRECVWVPVPPRQDTLALWALAQRLIREDVPPEEQPLGALRLTLKRLDAGDLAGLYGALAPEIARLQREKRPLPAAAGAWILCALADGKGEGLTC